MLLYIMLRTTDGSTNIINNPFRVAASIIATTFKGIIVSGTTGYIKLEQISDKHSLQRDLPQLWDGLVGSSFTLAT